MPVSGEYKVQVANSMTITNRENLEIILQVVTYLAATLGNRPAMVFKDKKLVDEPAVIPFVTLKHKQPHFNVTYTTYYFYEKNTLYLSKKQ